MSTVEQAVPQTKPQGSWFGRNWWWVLLLVLVGGGLLCAGICSGLAFLGIQESKKKEPYQLTLAAVRSDPTVIERLGEPIKDDWKVRVVINASGGRGEARINVPISGPKGTADVSSQAQLINGKWGLTTVEVTFSDGERHVLELSPEQAGGGEGDAPLWVPPGEVPPGAMPNLPEETS